MRSAEKSFCRHLKQEKLICYSLGLENSQVKAQREVFDASLCLCGAGMPGKERQSCGKGLEQGKAGRSPRNLCLSRALNPPAFSPGCSRQSELLIPISKSTWRRRREASGFYFHFWGQEKTKKSWEEGYPWHKRGIQPGRDLRGSLILPQAQSTASNRMRTLGAGLYPVGAGLYPVWAGLYPVWGGLYPVWAGLYPVWAWKSPRLEPPKLFHCWDQSHRDQL